MGDLIRSLQIHECHEEAGWRLILPLQHENEEASADTSNSQIWNKEKKQLSMQWVEGGWSSLPMDAGSSHVFQGRLGNCPKREPLGRGY